MTAKRFILACCTLGFLQTSFAGFERFWIFSSTADAQIESWDSLSEEEQHALIKRYQNLKENPEIQNDSLQQRMDWFAQLPEQEKQKMREAWQKMSSEERKTMRKKLERATTAEQRAEIRAQYLDKYLSK